MPGWSPGRSPRPGGVTTVPAPASANRGDENSFTQAGAAPRRLTSAGLAASGGWQNGLRSVHENSLIALVPVWACGKQVIAGAPPNRKGGWRGPGPQRGGWRLITCGSTAITATVGRPARSQVTLHHLLAAAS